MVWIIEFEVVPAGLCGVTVTTNKERQTEGGACGVVDALHKWDTGFHDFTFILDEDCVFEEEVPR